LSFVILSVRKNLILLLKGFYPRFFALKSRAQNDNSGVVLSNAKDLDLPVILNRVKNLVLLLKGLYPRFFALKIRAQNDTTRSFGACGSSG
jgi:hypothetical protein